MPIGESFGAYYNEHDPFAAAWLRNLSAAGKIAQGTVDDRDIQAVRGTDLAGSVRAHFFAGIGGWDLALRLAGWPDSEPVWTGSCPCQPFSAAGRRRGTADERHLWPHLRRLISECRPATVFGEQVASKAGRAWLAGVRADLEALGYRVGAADLCAAGVGAPQIRQRLYWVADTAGEQDRRLQPGGFHPESRNGRAGLEHASSDGRKQWRPESSWWGSAGRRGRDGVWRRIKPGLSPLVDGIPGRVGLLRGYGNAIVPQVAAEFVKAYLEARAN